MASINILVKGFNPSGYERAVGISRELMRITRPNHVRDSEDTDMMFQVLQLSNGDGVIRADSAEEIKVHPQKNITGLILLMPELSFNEMRQLVMYIESVGSFPFGAILPSTTTYIDEINWDEVI